jgi:hypothetical protein
MRLELGLDLLRALHGVDDRRKVHQKGVSHGFNDRAVMGGYGLLNHAIVDVEQAEHAGFVGPHLAAKADDVGEHDRRQSAIFLRRRATGVILHTHGESRIGSAAAWTE